MLNLMRKYATTWLIKFILGAIVVVFVFWGVGSYRSQKANRVALVNGEAITIEEYREAYNNIIAQLRQQFGKDLNDGLLEMLQVDKQAMNQLIDQKLIMGEVQRLNFRVTDKDLIDSIQKIQAFQRGGIFDNRLYQNILASNRLTPQEFEDIQRRAMLTEQMRAFIESGIKVSDLEAREWYNWKNTAVSVDFVEFDSSRYQNIKPDENEIKAYFEKNKSSYKTLPKIKVSYMVFDPGAYESLTQISDEEARLYYDDHRDEFKRPKTVEARHILFNLEQDANPQAVQAVRQKAVDVLDMAREGRDFAELAKQYSEGPTREAGGYLGAFKKEDMVKPFAERAFSMKAGEISEPVRTQFGWHIIKVEKVNEAAALSFSDAEPDIRKKLLRDKAKTMAYDAAETAYELTFGSDTLAQAATVQSLSVQTTDYFTQQEGPQQGIKDKSKFATIAFQLAEMEISEVQDIDDKYYIIQLADKIPEKIPGLKDVSTKVEADLIREKKNEKAQQDANILLTALKDGKNLKDEINRSGVEIKSTGFFKRYESIPNIGYEPDIAKAAFLLSSEKKLPEAVLSGNKGYYVILFKEKKEPEPSSFMDEKEQIVSNLLLQKRQDAFNRWLSQIREKSEIIIEDGYI